jgi:hypothetical protein
LVIYGQLKKFANLQPYLVFNYTLPINKSNLTPQTKIIKRGLPH